jgi:hypothetical protein
LTSIAQAVQVNRPYQFGVSEGFVQGFLFWFVAEVVQSIPAPKLGLIAVSTDKVNIYFLLFLGQT